MLPVEPVLSLSSRNLFLTEINFKWFLRRIWRPRRGGHPLHSAVILSCSLKSLERPGVVPCSWQHRLCCLRIPGEEAGFKWMQEEVLLLASSLILRVLSHRDQTFLEYIYIFQGVGSLRWRSIARWRSNTPAEPEQKPETLRHFWWSWLDNSIFC